MHFMTLPSPFMLMQSISLRVNRQSLGTGEHTLFMCSDFEDFDFRSRSL
jgi:hypothetical protein